MRSMTRMRAGFTVGILLIVLTGIMGSCTERSQEPLLLFTLVPSSGLENTPVESSSSQSRILRTAVPP